MPSDRWVSHDVSDATAFRKDGSLPTFPQSKSTEGGIVRLLFHLPNMTCPDKRDVRVSLLQLILASVVSWMHMHANLLSLNPNEN